MLKGAVNFFHGSFHFSVEGESNEEKRTQVEDKNSIVER